MPRRKPFEDLVGQTVGVFEVLALARPGPSRKARKWAVRCTHCRDEREITEAGLRWAATLAAGRCDGCKNRIESPPGTVFGERAVESQEPPVAQGVGRRVVVTCGCGETRSVRLRMLRAGQGYRCRSCSKRDDHRGKKSEETEPCE